jgi:hypothetical protein
MQYGSFFLRLFPATSQNTFHLININIQALIEAGNHNDAISGNAGASTRILSVAGRSTADG